MIYIWISSLNFIYKLIFKLFSYRIVWKPTPLTEEYLLKKGWVKNSDGMYYEPNVKSREVIYIRIDGYYYTVFHSIDKTYIATEKSVEWFEMYYLLIHGDNGRYELSNI